MFKGSKYSNVLSAVLVLAIIGIVIILGVVGYSIYRKRYIDNGAEQAVRKFQDSLIDQNTTNNNVSQNVVGGEITGIGEGSEDQNQTGNSTSGGNSGSTTGSKKRTKYKDFYVIGTIKIPSISLNYPILEKVTKKSLETSVAFLYGPGLNKVGNNVIIGHNYRNGTMFSNVKKLKNGDAIYITDTDGKQVKYKVYNSYRTSGDDATYMTRNTNGKREISLSTCTDDSKARLIVWAKEE